MILDNIRLYLSKTEPGRIDIRFVCKFCGKEMDCEEHAIMRTRPSKNESLFEFWCDECEKEG